MIARRECQLMGSSAAASYMLLQEGGASCSIGRATVCQSRT
uniref:Uncharacterized protein n=1 Tax=Anguilla anguilla TaxID=7936 RepID=A0A0E9V291_ANGAN